MSAETNQTPGVQTMLGAAGACPEIVHAGKAWKVGHPTQSAKKTLEVIARAAATMEVLAMKESLPPAAYKEMLDALTAKVVSRSFRTWGPAWHDVVFGPSGSTLFFLSLLRENHPDATEEDVAVLAEHHPEEVKLAVLEVIPNFILLLLDDLKGVTPDQRERIRGVMAETLARRLPTPTPGNTAT